MNYNTSSAGPSETGKRIRRERIRLQMTQEEFSRFLGISRSYLGALERGKRPLSRELLERLHNRLGLSSDYIMTGALPTAGGSGNALFEADPHHIRRDLSLIIGSCTLKEAEVCYGLIHSYLDYSRSEKKASPGSDLSERKNSG